MSEQDLTPDEQERLSIYQDMAMLHKQVGIELGRFFDNPNDPLMAMRRDRLNGLHTRLANLVTALQYINREEATDD